MNLSRSLSLVTLLAGALTVVAAAQTPPVPRPFPGSGGGTGSGSSTAPPRPAPGPATPGPADPAPVTSQPLAPAAAPTAGPSTAPTRGGDIGDVPLYPAAEYLATYEAGMGQRYVLYGSDAGFETVVAYYRQSLKNGGREIYRTPAVQQWDLGRFQEERMAYPPSVVVKDYSTGTPAGYLFVKGSTQKRYRTVIQVVPPPSAVTGR